MAFVDPAVLPNGPVLVASERVHPLAGASTPPAAAAVLAVARSATVRDSARRDRFVPPVLLPNRAMTVDRPGTGDAR